MLKVVIISNKTKDIGFATALEVAKQLEGRARVYMSEDCVLREECSVTYLPYDRLWQIADIAIVIGGDGTLLGVAPRCAENSIPAIGINQGTVGFLTEVEVAELRTALDKILNGDYVTEKRMLIEVRINDEDVTCHALNDIVVSKNDAVKIAEFDLYSGEEHVYHYKADGLIIATPTGSTGYSISAGGPVVDPRMDLYIATPICAHMLCARSAILPAYKDIIVKLDSRVPQATAVVTTDGGNPRVISVNDLVRISKSKYQFELIKIGNSSFYKTLLNKLS